MNYLLGTIKIALVGNLSTNEVIKVTNKGKAKTHLFFHLFLLQKSKKA